jgi:hypothetical protein
VVYAVWWKWKDECRTFLAVNDVPFSVRSLARAILPAIKEITMPRSVIILAAVLFLVLGSLAVVAAQSEDCGSMPADVSFQPSNCVQSGETTTLMTARFAGASPVSVYIYGSSGRVGDRDRGVRVDGDGVLRLKIDTTNFFGAAIPAGNYRVVIRDVTGQAASLFADFEVSGAAATPTFAPAPTTSPPPVFVTPTPVLVDNPSVLIVDVDKVAEEVTLQNASTSEVDLTGWLLVSVTGAEEHPIDGTLAPGQTRTFSNTGDEIWNDDEEDVAELYDPEGNLVDTFPR